MRKWIQGARCRTQHLRSTAFVPGFVFDPRDTGADVCAQSRDVPCGETQGATDAAKLKDRGGTPLAVFQRILGAARFSGFGLGAGRLEPRFRATDDGRLERATFRRPTLPEPDPRRGPAGGSQVPSRAQESPVSTVCLPEFLAIIYLT